MKGNPRISTYSDFEGHGAGTASLGKPSCQGTRAPARHMLTRIHDHPLSTVWLPCRVYKPSQPGLLALTFWVEKQSVEANCLRSKPFISPGDTVD